MFLVTRRRECAGRREWSSSKNAAVTLESLPEESGRNCCLSMLHGRETNLPCLSDITQIRCSFQETFRKLLRASLTSCAPGGAWYRFVVSRGTFYLFYLTRFNHFEGSYGRTRGNARNAPSPERRHGNARFAVSAYSPSKRVFHGEGCEERICEMSERQHGRVSGAFPFVVPCCLLCRMRVAVRLSSP